MAGRKKIEFLITGLLGVVLLGIIFKDFIFKGSKKLPLIQKKNVTLEVGSGRADLLMISESDRAKLDWGLDPFRVLVSAGVEVLEIGEWNLTGISWRQGRAAAIINDKIIHQGDSLGKFKVVDISKDRVSIQEGDQTLELYLKGEGS